MLESRRPAAHHRTRAPRSGARQGPRPIARIVALLLGIAAVSCDSTRELTPWFRIRTHHPILDQPVLIGGERHDVASARIGGKWVKVAEGRVYSAASSDRRAVVYLSGDGWRIVRETGEIASVDPKCTFPAFHPTGPSSTAPGAPSRT